MGRKRSSRNPVNVLFGWVRRQSVKVKMFLAVVSVVASLIGLKLLVRDRSHFFTASEAIHAVGIMILIYKLTRQKTCSGLSLKSQELTAIFLAARLYCSFSMENDIHTVLDSATLISTLWVIYMIRFKLKPSYMKEQDSLPIYYMVVPSALIALLIHPHTDFIIHSVLWAFCVYLESVSVLPQLRLMQNAKVLVPLVLCFQMIEPFTAHYVFALGVARFLGCAHWILRAMISISISWWIGTKQSTSSDSMQSTVLARETQVIEIGGKYLLLMGSSYLWLPMVLLTEVVQTFILADFCYYYVKSFVDGQLLVRLPPV